MWQGQIRRLITPKSNKIIKQSDENKIDYSMLNDADIGPNKPKIPLNI